MNENELADLKQFIAATVSQATASMATKDDIAGMATKDDIAGMATKDDIASISSKIDELDLKVDTISVALNERLIDHDSRVTKLEQRVA